MTTETKSQALNVQSPDRLTGDNAATHELLDDRVHKFRVELINRDGKKVSLKKGAISELVIQDSIFNWFHEGYLIYKNPHDFLERITKRGSGAQEVDVDTWRYRLDGRDYIYIYIDVPKQDDAVEGIGPGLNNKTYTIRLLCSIYEVEDILDSTDKGSSGKSKKIKFWDYRYARMQERQTCSIKGGWNTGQASNRIGPGRVMKKSLMQRSDSERSLYTGLAVKDFLLESLNEIDPSGGVTDASSGVMFADNFDTGSSTIFHSPIGDETMTDTLDILMSYHASSAETGNQPCILRVDRFTDEWSLLPIGDYYRRSYNRDTDTAGDTQNEIFYISGELSTGEGIPNNKSKVPLQGGDIDINIHNPDTGNIGGYEFTEMSALDNPNTVSVNMYSHTSGQFEVQQQAGDVERTRAHFQENVVDHAYGDKKSGAKASVVLNKTKKENKAINKVFSSGDSKISALVSGRNKTLKNLFFLGNAVHFPIKGMTNRQAGKIIAIERNTPYIESDFDSKLLGQYFVTSITHRISPKGYFNDIIAVKPFHFKDLKYNEDVT